jgi:muramoyltetrapeptide carboxypeptidase
MFLTRPPMLRRGDLVAVVAPASPFDALEFWRGMAWLRGRYRIRMRSDILAREAYLAGSDDRRTAELSAAMVDPAVKAIVMARGGYGITRIVDRLPWEAFAEAPKWLVGFSDVTALHLEAQQRGVASIHGPHVTGLAHASPWIRYRLLRALESAEELSWSGLRALVAGDAEGVLVGGNVALVEATAAAGRLSLPRGCVLALEDVTERPYRVDRMLTSLRLGGHLARAGAIVFGDFTQCDPGWDGRTIDQVLLERTSDLGIPVYAGAPFGHGQVNTPFVLGARVRLQAGTLSFS